MNNANIDDINCGELHLMINHVSLNTHSSVLPDFHSEILAVKIQCLESTLSAKNKVAMKTEKTRAIW